MADRVFNLKSNDGSMIPIKAVDLGDGTWGLAATTVTSGSGGSGGRKTLSYAFTRPGNTDPYLDNEVVNNSTSAGVDPSFSNAVRIAGAGFSILGAELCMTGIGSTTPKFMLELFRASLAAQNDGVAYTPSSGERATAIGILRYDGADAEIHNSTVKIPGRWDGDGAIGGSIDGGTTLYSKFISDGGWTPAASIGFTILLHTDRD